MYNLSWFLQDYYLYSDIEGQEFSKALEANGFIVNSGQSYYTNESCHLSGISGSIEFNRTCQTDDKTLHLFSNKLHKTSDYLPFIKNDHILNDQHFYLTFDKIYDSISISKALQWERCFIKPNQCLKLFEAFVFNLNDINSFKQCIDYIKTYTGVTDTTLCFVAEGKDIIEEYRIICDTSGVITGSRYMLNNEINIANEASIPDDALNLAHITSLIKPLREHIKDELIVIDIAKTIDDKFYIIELNCFSSSGLYLCNKDKIAKSLKKEMINYLNKLNEM